MIRYLILSVVFLVIAAQPSLAKDVQILPNYVMKLSIETNASKEQIWQLWSNVKEWKAFDERLEYSYLEDDQPFAAGAIGYVKGKGAPKTKFKLTEVKQGESFIEVLYLPLGQTIHLHRYFEPSAEDKTIFTHEVRFKGGLKGPYYLFLKGAFKKDLKLVMEKMKELAEKNSSE